MESLLNFQCDLSSRIAKAQINYKKSSKERLAVKSYTETRLETLEQLWLEFLSGHKDLMRGYSPRELKDTSYLKNEVFETTEELYIDYKCILKQALEQFNCVSKTTTDVKSSQVKLPKINIPIFSGKYSEWSTFRDLFQSLVHTNDTLDDVQKLHYLKGYLTGEAEQLLRHIPIIESNYKRCWQILEERYNNKRYVCHHILRKLFNQRSMFNESASNLKDLIDTTNDCLYALGNLNVDIKGWDVIIIYILTLKLDPESRRQWEFDVNQNSTLDELPTYKQFEDFMTKRYRAIEFLEHGSTYKRSQTQKQPVKKALHLTNRQCEFCSEEHRLGFCKGFAKETVDARRKFVESHRLCFICMEKGHSAQYCQYKGRCRVCGGRHHTLLHPQGNSVNLIVDTNDEIEEVEDNNSEGIDVNTEHTVTSCFAAGRIYSHELLATALILVESGKASYPVRALLDQESQSCFITESIVQLLGLRKIPVKGHISGLGEQTATCKAMVIVNIKSRINPNFVMKVEAYVLRTITALLPANSIECVEWPELRTLTLADPGYHTPGKIDLLLGTGVYGKIIQSGVKRGPVGAPVAQATSLGWILSGEIKTERKQNITKTVHCCTDNNDLLKRFWELESETELPRDKILKEDEKHCEDIFDKTTYRDKEGRYVVKLPFRTSEPKVDSSQAIAERRLYSLEKRLNRNKELKEKYREVMSEYLDLNHMELVPENEMSNPSAIYLPHHAVVREDKDTTKVRVVFDASCKGTNNKSLNDNLLVGPTLQADLRHLVMRWRQNPICLTADIAKMYRQVKVNESDVNYQRILWREDPQAEIKHYRLLRVTFGIAAAPFLAVKALQQLAVDEGVNYPLAAEKVKTDYYMDDLLTGCQNIEEGLQLYYEMNGLLAKGKFDLLKWSSNSKELMSRIEDENLDRNQIGKTEALKIKTDEITKIVGLIWNRNEDSFRYVVNITTLQSPITKRKILSDISRLYDPMGWVGPTIILAKIIIQRLWLAGIDWDAEVPNDILNEWLAYRQELNKLTEINIPRWIHTKIDDSQIELHGFCDASKTAYAAVVYIRVIDADGEVHVQLVSAKTKVAPVKQVSIPRLELCGAVLLTKLIVEIASVLKVDKTNLHAWTDSTVVLAWLNSHPSRWKVFVANRVSEIITDLDPHSWAHVPSKQNPADCASRGLRPMELVSERLWFEGPEFLALKTIHYKKETNTATNLEEIKVHCATVENFIWNRFSTLTRMIRVIAYCRRFVQYLKEKPVNRCKSYLTTLELAETLNVILKQDQACFFKADITTLRQGHNLPKNSKLRALNPLFDENGILRVGGRLDNSALDENRKHPILLSKGSYLTHLIIADAHKQTLHGGPQLMLCYIQMKYWILGAKQLIKSYVRKCVTCIKNTSLTQTQLMGQLPSARVTPTRPFKCSGVDYGGPIQIRTTKGRGHQSHKGYICLFVCMVTRAIHLEVVTDYTAEGFLQAYRRFVSRRGMCSEIWSDNATNFVGASSELKRLFETEKKSMLIEVAETLATNGCNWHFIPARSPNFGGLWEAGVKSVKHHLKRVIGQSTLTYEEMSTVLAQIEACLNSRPQSVISTDTEDMMVVTPGHFLIGEPLVTSPDRNYELVNVGSLKRWQYTQKMLQEFWRSWSQQYLTKFYHRYRWASQNPEPKIGDVVVVREDGLPPCRWLLGRVVGLHPGLDNIVRVVTLKVKNGILKRSVSKLCLLPVETN